MSEKEVLRLNLNQAVRDWNCAYAEYKAFGTARKNVAEAWDYWSKTSTRKRKAGVTYELR